MADAQPKVDDALESDDLDALEDEAEESTEIMIQNTNGDDVYDNIRVFLGFLQPSYYLLIPRSVEEVSKKEDGTNVDLLEFGKKEGPNAYLNAADAQYRTGNPYVKYGYKANQKIITLRITAMNYISLRRAGLDSANAYVCAALRARWILTGAYNTYKHDSLVGYNEIIIVDTAEPDYGRFNKAADTRAIVEAMGGYAPEFIKAAGSETYGMKWVINHADNFWASVEHCFRVRGHHFKTTAKEIDSYKDLYGRFLVSCYEGNFEWPAEVEMFHVFHTAIHPFRIKTLPQMVVHYLAHGTLANGAIIRLSGAPVGNALITTTVAALDTMRGEVWFAAFDRIYSDGIKRASSYSEQILDNKYGFHLSARLYGIDRKDSVTYEKERITMDKAKAYISSIGAACQGMIHALSEAVEQRLITGFALSNARALEKSAAGSPLITLRVKQLVLASIEQITDADNITEAIAGALPTLEAVTTNAVVKK